MHIKIDKGLDIPIKGIPEGLPKPLIPSGEARPYRPKRIALDLSEFSDMRFKLLAKVGDSVKIGDPIATDRLLPGRFFVSPAAGVISEINRGLKRVLLNIVIDVDENEKTLTLPPLSPETASQEELIERLKTLGGFSHIKKRPFNLLADPENLPKSIFVKAIESLPFVPPPEFQVEGHEKLFQAGLDTLKRLTEGNVNLVYRAGSTFRPFTEAKNVVRHTAEGPHPISNFSLHIQEIDPILSAKDIVWTINAHDVVVIGSIVTKGEYFIDRIIGIGGPAVLEGQAGFFKVREGYPVEGLVEGRIPHAPVRLISGDPLTGVKVSPEDFLTFNAYAFSIIRENTDREMLHFMRLGANKFSTSGAYLSGHLKGKDDFDFTTSQHGEKRAFIDSSLYDKVQPLHIPTMQLVKAVMSEDYDLAENLGFLEVDPEDFALPAFVDPSKIDMMGIIKNGQKKYALEVLE